MKQLVCEMCGGTDLVKQNGIFVCQTCGTKYSVEEAKKMMVEGLVDVSGSTIKVDDSDELANLYQIARRAKDDNNSENAAKYYDMILIKDPNSWEAAFYSVYFRALQCKIAQISSAAISVANCIDSVFKLIKSTVDGKDAQIAAVREIVIQCSNLFGILTSASMNHFKGIEGQIALKFLDDLLNDMYSSAKLLFVVGDAIESNFWSYEEVHSDAVSAWSLGIQCISFNLINKATDKNIKQRCENARTYYVKKTQKYDGTYQPPTINTESSGCYIATAVYGSYDCPQVWTLRRFRDNTLAETWYGRAFIHIYYAISPTLVKRFGHTEWFKKFWKGKLDRMVASLNADGVENTPYEDKDW